MDEVFRFKQFDLSNSRSALKVGTDAVLLGAAVGLSRECSTVLDIGTGTGVIALVIAQRLAASGVEDFHITGIDIDAPSAGEARDNFASSPWADHLMARHVSLQDFADRRGEGEVFDLIVSNPPYYDESLVSDDPHRSMARHTGSMSYREVITFAGDALSTDGCLALILPKQEESHLVRFASSFGLRTRRILSIRTSPSKTPKRIVAEFVRSDMAPADGMRNDHLTIQEGGTFTEEYRLLTSEFYLNF